MAIPASFAKSGLLPYEVARREGRKFRRLLIISDGPADSGKTEFALSAPTPGAAVCLDRGFDGLADNPNPPATRQPLENWGLSVVKIPKVGQQDQAYFQELWKVFRTQAYAIADNPDVRTFLLDGDSDSWEVQRVAEFGKLAKVPSILYDNVNQARKGFYNRLFDSGKIIIATCRVRKVYVTKTLPNGQPEFNAQGNEVRVWNGEYEHQGFGDTEYLWNIQLMHYRTEDGGFGVRITKCKSDPAMVGFELEGEDCCFQGLVRTVFPSVPLKEWGY